MPRMQFGGAQRLANHGLSSVSEVEVMNIRIGDPIDLTILEQELPETELWVNGSLAAQAPFQVFILQETHQQIWRQVKALPNIECGGVLVGHPFKTPDQSITFV